MDNYIVIGIGTGGGGEGRSGGRGGKGGGGWSHSPQLCHTAHNFYSYLSAKSEAAGGLYKRATLPVAKISAMWVYTSMREGVDCNRKVHVSLITSPPNDTCIHLYPPT